MLNLWCDVTDYILYMGTEKNRDPSLLWAVAVHRASDAVDLVWQGAELEKLL